MRFASEKGDVSDVFRSAPSGSAIPASTVGTIENGQGAIHQRRQHADGS